MKNLILFDMDGVILDSAPAIVASLEAALLENGIPLPDREFIRGQVGPPLRKMLASILGDSPQLLHEKCAATYRLHNDRYGPENTLVYPEAENVIPLLLGRVRMRVATSKAEQSAQAVMHHFHLARYFDDIHGTLNPASDTKVDVMKRAIDSHLRQYPASRILAMVGDRAQDIEAARTLGVPSIAVMWGYAVGDELVDSAPDFVAEDAGQLMEIVSQLFSTTN